MALFRMSGIALPRTLPGSNTRRDFEECQGIKAGTELPLRNKLEAMRSIWVLSLLYLISVRL